MLQEIVGLNNKIRMNIVFKYRLLKLEPFNNLLAWTIKIQSVKSNDALCS